MAQSDRDGEWDAERERRFREGWVEAPPRVDGEIRLAEYDAGWPVRYEREARAIRGELGEQVVQLEHIGSTSVPGLAAKPIIDVLLVVPDPVDEVLYIPGLERAGFRLVIREPDWHEHRLLRKRPDSDVTVHTFGPDSPEIERYLRFRDHLRGNEADRRLYEDTKRRLAGRRWQYTQQYANAKTEVVEAIMARAAGLWGRIFVAPTTRILHNHRIWGRHTRAGPGLRRPNGQLTKIVTGQAMPRIGRRSGRWARRRRAGR